MLKDRHQEILICNRRSEKEIVRERENDRLQRDIVREIV